jgi:membrane protein implicated in regulation of membrane protease activity
MNPELWWWIAAAVAVAAELASGTFYLLMVALGLVSGGLAAVAGVGLVGQLLAAALVGGGAVAGWAVWRQRSAPGPAGSDATLQLDVGHAIEVTAWQPDGSARAHYRGSDWAVRWHGSPAEPPPGPGRYVIRGQQGNELIVGR